jgi:uncharacterized protein (DUF2252 family)
MNATAPPRTTVPRSAHGAWSAAPERPDPVGILTGESVARVPELVPIRYGRMLASPFTFFRGAAAIMAADLAGTPDSGLTVQACGDAHISNFGGFAAPDRRLVFDINDFDETLPAPWEWDVKRMAASIEIAGRERKMTAKERRTLVRASVSEYRRSMIDLAERGNLDIWYARLDVDTIRDRFGSDVRSKELANLAALESKARRKNSLRALTKLTRVVDGKLRFASVPPLLVPIEELQSPEAAAQQAEMAAGLIASYVETLSDDRRQLLGQYRYTHLARKVVGVGSVGTRAWVMLLQGRDEDDPLVLQAKEAEASVLEPYAGASTYATHGERVVNGQRLMQAASDIFLGWETLIGLDGVERDFYVRQLWDGKTSVETETMTLRGLTAYVRMCGWTLARAHARSGDREAIAEYLGGSPKFDKAIARFAASYADQNERDYAAMQEAVATGRIEARSDL